MTISSCKEQKTELPSLGTFYRLKRGFHCTGNLAPPAKCFRFEDVIGAIIAHAHTQLTNIKIVQQKDQLKITHAQS